MLDLLISGGLVHDGDGSEPSLADVAVADDRVVAIGAPGTSEAALVIDAAGKAVAPGFINILSHSNLSILHDPRSLGELTQGVTTEVFGEGTSMGPLTPTLAAEIERSGSELGITVSWTRLSEYLRHVERQGVAQNVASFIGAGTLRAHAVGYDDRPATQAELDRMRGLVAEEMADGALGIASALIYPPGSYAPTEELTALCAASAPYGGRYASHVRNEALGLLDALGELVGICRTAGVPGEVFHLKAAGRPSWGLMDPALERIETARAEGLPITADVYPYTASSTGLTSIIPARYHEGGPAALYDRLTDPAVRSAIRSELVAAGRLGDGVGADEILVLAVREEANRPCQGRTLADVARERNTDPIETALDLIATDRSRVGVAFFSMCEENLRAALTRPWVAISSDGTSMAPEGVFLRSSTHPRAYGSFARVLGHYVRETGVLSLREAVHRMSGLPARTLGLRDRGQLRVGAFADIVVFDPSTVADRATFAEPHQLSVGVSDVVVNGQVAIRDGTFTGALAGRALAGPGRREA